MTRKSYIDPGGKYTGAPGTPETAPGTLGTAWTAPGRGATPGELSAAVWSRPPRGRGWAARRLRRALARLAGLGDGRTNLRLTGARLTLYDLRRVEEAR